MADGGDTAGNEIRFVRITDITEQETGSCDSSVEFPGAEIFGVVLRSNDGSIHGYGEILSGTDTLTGSTGILNGLGYDYEGESSNGNCPAFNSVNFFGLGCGGSAVVGFARTGNSLALQSGQTLEVREYGEQCGGDRASHAIRVDACPRGTTESEVRNGNVTCDNTLATGSGKLEIDISLDGGN
ncbi:MAG: hypothetical protein ABEN55_08675 [Bradymonadaceae bacterium]